MLVLSAERRAGSIRRVGPAMAEMQARYLVGSAYIR
jgi:hypothetical protein